MAYITSQWIKGVRQRNAYHTPEYVRIFNPRSSAESYRKLDDDNFKLDWGKDWEKENNITYKIGFCRSDDDSHPTRCSTEYKAVYIQQQEVETLLKGLFYSNSKESNREFLRGVVPNISDEFKFEMIKILLKDE
jgi:hypothetical protein